jgi:hypothetical protein
MHRPIQINTMQYQNVELLFLLSGYQINLHVLPILSTLIFDRIISKNKRKNFWIVQIYNFPNAFCSRLRLSSGFGPDYDVILPADILPIPVMLPPIADILSPVIFCAITGIAVEIEPMTAAMPNAATIATAASRIFVFICVLF